MKELLQITLCAVLLDLLLGDPRWLPHPVVAIGRLIGALERGLRRLIANERGAGVLLLLLTVGITCGAAALLLAAAQAVHFVAQRAHLAFEPASVAPPFALAQPGGEAADQHAED